MRVIEESEKADLRLNIQKTKITASSPINFMANRWGKVETVTNFIFLGFKITADGGSHEIKIQLLLRRKTMTNLYSMLKSRYITLPTKVCIIKFVVFPVVMYGCESAKKLMLSNCGAGDP